MQSLIVTGACARYRAFARHHRSQHQKHNQCGEALESFLRARLIVILIARICARASCAPAAMVGSHLMEKAGQPVGSISENQVITTQLQSFEFLERLSLGYHRKGPHV